MVPRPGAPMLVSPAAVERTYQTTAHGARAPGTGRPGSCRYGFFRSPSVAASPPGRIGVFSMYVSPPASTTERRSKR